MHWFWSSGFWVFPIVMMTLMVIVVFICAHFFLGRDGRGCCGRHGSGELTGQTALDVVKQRYARGEITKQEYEEIKNTFTD